jgi:O-antigen/teichoic acid export membrane protein
MRTIENPLITDGSLKARWQSYLPTGSLRARYARGAMWMMAGSGAAQFLTAVCGIVIARILGVERYGALGIVTSTIAMFNVVAELSLGLTTNKHVAEYHKSDPSRAGRIIALGTILTFFTGAVTAVMVAIFAEPLAVHALKAPEIAHYLRIGAPLLLISAINGVQMGTLTGFEKFRAMSVGRMVIGLVTVPLLVTGVIIGGLAGVVVGQIVAGCVGLIWFRLAIMRESHNHGVVISYRDAWQERSVLLSFALPSLLSGLMNMPVIWAANAILVRSANGMAEMGMFNAASQWRNLIIWIPATVGQVALPILTSLLHEGDQRRFRRTLMLNICVNLFSSLAIAIPIALGSYWIMSLYGAEFSHRWLALAALSGAAVLQATINVIGQVIASASRMWWGFILNLLWAGELLVLTWHLVRFGANGVGAAHLLAYLLHLIQVSAYVAWVLQHDARLVGTPALGRQLAQPTSMAD